MTSVAYRVNSRSTMGETPNRLNSRELLGDSHHCDELYLNGGWRYP